MLSPAPTLRRARAPLMPPLLRPHRTAPPSAAKAADHRLKRHHIVCGYGRVGRQVVDELVARGLSTVVIEPSEELFPDTLSARALNPDLLIVARAIQHEAEDKFRRAGATQVISPYRIGGQRIVTQLLHPRIADFLDVVMHRRDLELWLEEITITSGGSADGRSLAETAIWGPGGLKVLAVSRRGGDLVASPRGELRLGVGDVLIALGTLEQLAAARRVAGEDQDLPADRQALSAEAG